MAKEVNDVVEWLEVDQLYPFAMFKDLFVVSVAVIICLGWFDI